VHVKKPFEGIDVGEMKVFDFILSWAGDLLHQDGRTHNDVNGSFFLQERRKKKKSECERVSLAKEVKVTYRKESVEALSNSKTESNSSFSQQPFPHTFETAHRRGF
jgi:hypothetical protein